ncbi:MAG: hypothetical protein K2F57_04735, partial [Candidatus Gastranaerophilales bacterium]|nr:hypothetical protein [Candidatus Gastranaerophilales bacterium]
ASGVLNVGSLSVTTPTQETYNYYKANPNKNLSGLYSTNSNSSVQIDGTIIAANNVDINSGKIIVSQNGNILAGTGNNITINSNSQAENLFNNLVNIDNIHSAENLANINGNITITSSIGTEIIGNIQNNGKGNIEITNHGQDGILISGKSINNNGDTLITNNGENGLNIEGLIKNKGNSIIMNNAGKFTIGGSFENDGNAEFINNGENLEIEGSITNKTGKLAMLNQNGGINITGTIQNDGTTTEITNNGDNGINIENSITSNGDLTITNTGENGINLQSLGKFRSNSNITITNTGSNGVNVKGLVNAKKNVKIDNKNSNVVIGDNTQNNNYITAGNNIDIIVVDGNLLNYGVEKTLLNAAGNLNMDVTNGTIGEAVQQEACKGSGCTGIGPKEDGSRDFTKSINANIKGKVNAKTTNTK